MTNGQLIGRQSIREMQVVVWEHEQPSFLGFSGSELDSQKKCGLGCQADEREYGQQGKIQSWHLDSTSQLCLEICEKSHSTKEVVSKPTLADQIKILSQASSIILCEFWHFTGLKRS